MISKHYLLIIFFLAVVIFSSSHAQDNTQAGLPEGAIERLGKGGINIMQFSPDGTYLAVGTDVGVWLYDVQNGDESALFTGHTGHVNALAFSDDGYMLASGGFNNPVIQIWDIERKNKLTTIPLTQAMHITSAITFYGRTLISVNTGSELSFWQVDTGNQLSSFKFDNPYTKIVFSPDGSMLAGSDNIKEFHLWNTTNTNKLGILTGQAVRQDMEIFALAFSPDNRIFASGSKDKTVKLWDTQNYTKIDTLRGHNAWVSTIAFSNDSKTLASGDAGNVIKLWDLELRKERATLTGHKNTINALVFSPEGTPVYGMCLASGSADGTIKLWNPQEGKELITFTTGHIEWVTAVAFSEDGKRLTSAAFNGNVDTWSLESRQVLTSLPTEQSTNTEISALSPNANFFAFDGWVSMIVFNPVGFGLQSGGSSKVVGLGNNKNNILQLWDLVTGEKLPLPLQNGGKRYSAAAFSQDNSMFALSSHKELRAWHLNSGRELFQINTARPMFTETLIFSPDGKRLASASRFHSPQIWDISTQQNLTPSNINRSDTLAFSPDSSMIATVSRDGIYLWNIDKESEDEPNTIPGDFHGFKNELVFSPDGTILLSSGKDSWSTPIKLWDVATGTSLGKLSGHTESVETLVFSHDGRILASGGQDGTVILWDWEKISDMTTDEK